MVYTFRIEAVVDMRSNYQMSFTPKEVEKQFASAATQAATIQLYHTKFTPTIQEAVIDLREKAAIMAAYGGIKWLSIDLYRVSGEGPSREKKWELIGEYDEPNDVPGF